MIMKFGLTFIGHHVAVKFNAKLTPIERENFATSYCHIVTVSKIGKGLTRIEGCLDPLQYGNFKTDLDIAIKQSKIERLMAEVDALEEHKLRCTNEVAFADPLDELPF